MFLGIVMISSQPAHASPGCWCDRLTDMDVYNQCEQAPATSATIYQEQCDRVFTIRGG